MKKMIATVTALAAATAIGTMAPASADSASKHVATGSYHAATGNFRCVGQVHDDGDGGTLSLRVGAFERRLENDHFRTDSAATRVIAQELNYRGRWVSVKRSAWRWGSLGATIDEGSTNRSHVVFGGTTSPTMALSVNGFDDLFRLKSVTLMFNDEGNRIAKLVNHEGNCRV